MAIGASARNVQGMVSAQTLAGGALGTLASWGLAGLASGLLYGVAATDPPTFAAMLLVLTFVAAVAGCVPARRASRIDPMAALRAESASARSLRRRRMPAAANR